MDQSPSNTETLDVVVSWAAFALLVATAAAFAWHVPRNRDAMEEVFNDFKLELPSSTKLACAVPTIVIVALSAAAVAGSLAVQIISRSKRSASLFHLLLVFGLVILFLVYREAMGNPFVTLIEGMSSRSPGR